ncbi:MAG: protein kinase [Myxococcota bacterium]
MSRQDPKDSSPKTQASEGSARGASGGWPVAVGSDQPSPSIPADAIAAALISAQPSSDQPLNEGTSAEARDEVTGSAVPPTLAAPSSPPDSLPASPDLPSASPEAVLSSSSKSSASWPSIAAPAKASALSAARRTQRRFRQHEVLGGKYRLEKSIARGGMGWIFLATQLPLGRQVAIKVVIPQPGDGDFRQRFLLEASTCAKLSHPNIVTIHDYGQTEDGDVFMAMEYLDGRSLARTLAEQKRLSPDRASRIVLQVARALRVAHRAGVVHRDLKPSNVMLLPDNETESGQDRVKVVDFGLAKIFEGAQRIASMQITQSGVMLGSPRYMSPEQIRNRDVDPRTDIYSLGALYYVMLAGKPPFDGDNATDILAQHLRDPVPSLDLGDDDFHHAINAIVQRCLKKRVEDRYPTIDALLSDLSLLFQRLPDSSGLAVDTLTGSMNADWASLAASAAPEAETAGPGPAATSSAARAWWTAAFVLFGVVGVLGWWAFSLD